MAPKVQPSSVAIHRGVVERVKSIDAAFLDKMVRFSALFEPQHAARQEQKGRVEQAFARLGGAADKPLSPAAAATAVAASQEVDRALAEAACAVSGGGPLDEAAFKTAMDAALVVEASRECVRNVKAGVASDLESEAAPFLGGRREEAPFLGGRREERRHSYDS